MVTLCTHGAVYPCPSCHASEARREARRENELALWQARAEAAERECRRLRVALENIFASSSYSSEPDATVRERVDRLARAALAPAGRLEVAVDDATPADGGGR